MTGLDAQAALEALRSGGFVVLLESNDAEAEGNLMSAAQFVSPDSLRAFSSHAMGALYLCLTDARCAELGLASDPSSDGPWQPGSIALRGVAGSSSSRDDHARTIQALLNPSRGPEDFERIGYVHPLRARPGGVLQRAGRTEAALDLVRLAGCQPAALLSLVRTEDGDVARGDGLRALAERNGFPVVTVGAVIALRRQTDKLVERVATARLPTEFGVFTVIGFRGILTDTNHLALVRGDVDGATNVLVRVHTECLVGDVFQALRARVRATSSVRSRCWVSRSEEYSSTSCPTRASSGSAATRRPRAATGRRRWTSTASAPRSSPISASRRSGS